jgi:uncharacterized protein (TIGR03790 family)
MNDHLEADLPFGYLLREPESCRARVSDAHSPARWTCFGAGLFRLVLLSTVALCGPASAAAQSAENVLVVINDASPASRKIGEYYIKQRTVPSSNVVHIRTDTDDTIERVEYLSTIEGPIAGFLSRHALQDRILYIVLTKGTPLRINGTSGQDGTVASVDSELALLYKRMTGIPLPVQGRVANPYYLDAKRLRDAQPFTHRAQELFLVTRLDAFTVEEVIQLIDRAQQPATEGLIVLDQRAGLSNSPGDDWMAEAAGRLQDLGHSGRVRLDTSSNAAPAAEGVLGYFSWGSNDPGNRKRSSGLRFVPGSLAATLAGSDARTFAAPPADWVPAGESQKPNAVFAGSTQSLAGDLIREGVTGVAGNVAEPQLLGAIRPQILFPAYLAGFNLAESFYLAMPSLSWQTVVVGDPLCRPFERKPLTRAEIEDPLDQATELPGVFSRRRLEVARGLLKGAPDEGLRLLLTAEARQARGDAAGARSALERGTEAVPNAAGAHLQLALIYEKEGEYGRAAERYRAILKVEPRNVIALNNLAYTLAVRENKPSEAHPYAKLAVALAPTNPTLLDTLGWIEHLTGNSEMAAKLLAIAVGKLPHQAEVRVHAAIAFAAAGDLKRAATELQEALRLDPSVQKRPDVMALQQTLAGKRQ